VLHVPAHSPSLLPRILERNGLPPARHPSDGEAIEPGRISIAPPDQHMLLEGGRVRLIRGPRESGHRPAVDPLFRNVGAGVRPPGRGRGALGQPRRRHRRTDGDQAAGGVTVVQDPEEALVTAVAQIHP
jgi:two-component system chemotaxis response regulator CheB